MSIPYRGTKFTFVQPNGTRFQVQGWGNQHHALFRTLDGYPVVRNPVTGYYDYASIGAGNALHFTGLQVGIDSVRPTSVVGKTFSYSEAKSLIFSNPGLPRSPSRWQIRSERKRHLSRSVRPGNIAFAPPNRQTTGKFVGLCILIDFPDLQGTISKSSVDEFLNSANYSGFGNNGSVRQYFNDVSSGALDYTNLVTSIVTARHNRDYYTDPTVPQPFRTYELIGEALANLTAGGFDFRQLTLDDEGYIYAINIFYAGQCVNNWSEGLWPHQYHLVNPVLVAPGCKAFDYQITNIGTELSLGTFCHENGHMICDFPDLYDYGNESAGSGAYCLMSAGATVDATNPPQVGAYLKYRAGWATSITHITGGTQYRLQGGNDLLLYEKDDQEYFILERRIRAGRDAALPGSGLAIWHIDEMGSNENEQASPASHYECSLLQADGRYDLEHDRNTGDAYDLYPAQGNTSLSDNTTPSSRWWNGQRSGLSIMNISDTAESITFNTL